MTPDSFLRKWMSNPGQDLVDDLAKVIAGQVRSLQAERNRYKLALEHSLKIAGRMANHTLAEQGAIAGEVDDLLITVGEALEDASIV